MLLLLLWWGFVYVYLKFWQPHDSPSDIINTFMIYPSDNFVPFHFHHQNLSWAQLQ